MKSFSALLRITLLAALLAATALSARPVTPVHAQGAIIAVGTADDEDPYDPNADNGYCSLREAIYNANNNTQIGNDDCAAGSGTGNDTIIFAPGVVVTSLGSDLPHITDPAGLTINGGDVVIIHGQYQHQLFYVNQVPLTLQSINLVGGYDSYNGGGIFNDGGTVTVTYSLFYLNSSYVGGAIYSSGGTLTVANSRFLENSAFSDGGAIYVTYQILASDPGIATFVNNTFSSNRATYSGGDLYANYYFSQINLVNNIFANSGGGGHCFTNLNVTGSNNLIEHAIFDRTCELTNGVDGNLVGVDPQFDPNHWAWWMPSKTSPVIDAGLDSACVNTVSYYGVPRPQGLHCDIGAFEYPQTLIQAPYYSDAARDGWVLESSETSGIGGSKNNTATTFRVGDDASNKQYRSILSFHTDPLPANATLKSIALWLKPAGVAGKSPFLTHGPLLVDLRTDSFANNPALQPADFKAIASKNAILTIPSAQVNGWYTQSFAPADYSYFQPGGDFQLRLRFTKDDNNDLGADFLKFYTGNSTIANTQPMLLIEYYIR